MFVIFALCAGPSLQEPGHSKEQKESGSSAMQTVQCRSACKNQPRTSN